MVETFPSPLKEEGKKTIHESAQRAPSQNNPNLFYLGGYTNNAGVYLNPKIRGVDKYPLGTVYNFSAFQGLCLEVAVGYFLEYALSHGQQKHL